MTLPTLSRPRRPGADPLRPDRSSFAGGLLARIFRWKSLVGLLLLATVLWPIFHYSSLVPNPTQNDEFLGGSNGESRNNGSLRLTYTDDWNDTTEGLPLQNVVKEDTTEHITENNENNELDKRELSLQTTNTTNSEQQEKGPPSRESNKVNPSSHHQTDTRLRQFMDQLAVAKAYLEFGLTQSQPRFIEELRGRVADVQRLLLEATTDSELPQNSYKKSKAMEEILSKGKQIIDDCATAAKNLRGVIRSTDGQLRLEKKESLFLNQLLAKTIPKGLHCLSLRLSIQYSSLNSTVKIFSDQEKIEDPRLYHYAIFSDNVLAAAVVVNSTISHVKHPGDHVFHVVTDELNYAAMRMWFLSNRPRTATVQVQKVEEFTWLNSSYSPVLKQLESEYTIDYYFRTQGANTDGNLKYRNPKYLSILNHLRFYLPEIFPKLNKVVFLDDDVVVQKELIPLWGIDLKGKVNGAVETCGRSFHRFDKYLNFSNPLISRNFDPNACGWAYGMNVFDLAEWRRQNMTDAYHSWQKLNHDRRLWKLGSLPPGLITFYNYMLPLDRHWHVLGLGYDENVKEKDIDRAAVIHYNGNKKPWLEIGITKYRPYWSRYVNYGHIYLRQCNIIP